MNQRGVSSRIVRIPALSPNMPGGGWMVDCSNAGYPKGAQLAEFVDRAMVAGIVPSGTGCTVYLITGRSVNCVYDAKKTAELIDWI